MDRKRREESAIKDRIKEKQNEKSEGMQSAVLTRLHLSASALKYLALLAMTADHIAVICRPHCGDLQTGSGIPDIWGSGVSIVCLFISRRFFSHAGSQMLWTEAAFGGGCVGDSV